MSNNKELDDYLDQIMGNQPQQQNSNNGGWKDININNRFSGMIPTTKEDLMAFAMQQKQVTSQQNGVSHNQAFTKEGFDVYKPISNMNNNVDLATKVGSTSDLNGKEFIVHHKKRFMVVEDYRTAIDLSKMEGQKFVNLVVIEAPFIGKLLVPEQAIRTFQNNGGSKAILKG